MVSNAQEAVSKVEGNFEVMNKAAEALTLKENDMTSSLRSYLEVTQEFVNKNAKATEKSAEQEAQKKAVEKNGRLWQSPSKKMNDYSDCIWII